MSKYQFSIIFLSVLNGSHLLVDKEFKSTDLLSIYTILERSRWCPLKSLANFFWFKVCSFDKDTDKQKGRNVPLASADVCGRGILRDEPKECLFLGGYLLG